MSIRSEHRRATAPTPAGAAERTFDPRVVLEVLRSILPADDVVALHEPEIGARDRAYVQDCLDSGWVSSIGAYVDRFETMVADIAGTRHAVAVVNGTAALHIALLVAGVGRDDEVLIPALTFVATANAVAYLGAIPHFVDCEEGTLGIDPRRLADHLRAAAERTAGGCRNRQTGRRIAAVVPVHVFGHPVDMDPLLETADRWGIAVVEDAAEAVGSRYKDRPAGSFGTVAAFSFNGNKIVTTGGGGAMVTDDDGMAARARHLVTTAKRPHPWAYDHDAIAFNYRMPGLNAALGCAQIESLPEFIVAKRRLAARYAAAFAAVDGVRALTEQPFATSNYWLNALLLDEPFAHARDDVLARANDAGIRLRPAWTPMHHLPMYGACPRMDLGVTESVAARLVNLPSSARLGRDARAP